ncbi:hypothetical protein AO268_10805 [Pseudomonas sp. ICMP 8385]|nr:hypothetical protein AO268_10805 [Pseudomonas sp. ICMP 8385]
MFVVKMAAHMLNGYRKKRGINIVFQRKLSGNMPHEQGLRQPSFGVIIETRHVVMPTFTI